jgi:excisionase family DNA binding protein
MSGDEVRDVLTVAEAASLLKCDRLRVYKLISAKRLHVLHLGRSIRIAKRNLEALPEELLRTLKSRRHRTSLQRKGTATTMSEEHPKRARRGRGEGALFQRKSDGLWCARVSTDYKRSFVYARTKSDVLKKLDQLRQGGEARNSEYERLTLDRFLDRWLSDAVDGSVRPSTHALYSSIAKNQIKPHLGTFRVRRITADDVSKMLSKLEKAGASARMRQIVLSVLHRALNQAMRWEITTRNVCALVTRPRARRREIHALTNEQIEVFLKAAASDRYHALYVLALATGMRVGELLGLQWVDVDDELGVLTVRRQIVRRPKADDVAKSTELAEPKTSVGRRRIDLPVPVLETLRAHREAMKLEGHADLRDHVFCTKSGVALQYKNLIDRSFAKVLKKAAQLEAKERGTEEGAPWRFTFHSLRHTAASMLLRAGVHPKVVSERLGHARVGFTLDVYSHLLPSMQRDAANRISSIFQNYKVQSGCSDDSEQDAPARKKPH